MGLFGRNRRREHRSLVSTIQGLRGYGWQSDGTGVQSNGWVGGDIQVGDSYSARFVSLGLPGSLITVTFYAVEYDECPGEFAVQRQVEWMICENIFDPGGTEIWSSEACDDVTEIVIYSAAEAEDEARGSAEDTLERAWAYEGWDGQPFDGGTS